MSEHTPGPWEIYPDGDRKHILRAGSLKFVNTSLTQADWIAELDPDGTGHDEDETEANARLIAAAPDLLDACKAIVNRLVRAGVNIRVVQMLARHASPSTTLQFYARATEADLRAAVEALTEGGEK